MLPVMWDPAPPTDAPRALRPIRRPRHRVPSLMWPKGISGWEQVYLGKEEEVYNCNQTFPHETFMLK